MAIDKKGQVGKALLDVDHLTRAVKRLVLLPAHALGFGGKQQEMTGWRSSP
jgi:hypothetical protein